MITRAAACKFIVLLALIAVLGLPAIAHAQLTWDSSGVNPTAPVDGSGLWDTTTNALWSNGGADSVWANGSSVIFGGVSGTPGTVTIDDPAGVSVAGSITFNVGGYTIASSGSANTLTLTTTPTITVNGSFTDTISAFVTGTSGFTLAGTGTLLLTNANNYSGTTTISSGFLELGNANAAQNSTVSVGSANGLTFAAAGTYNILGLTGNSGFALSDTTGAQNVTLSVGGTATTSVFAGTLTNGLGGGIGSLVKTGTGTFTLSANQSYTGATTLNAGALTIGGVLQSTQLNLGGGTLTFTAVAGNPANFTGGTAVSGASSVVASAVTGTVALGAITRSAGGAVNFTLPTVTGTITATNANVNGILGGYATVGGAGWAVSGGDGTNPGAISALATYTANTWGAGLNTDVTSNSAPISGSDTNTLRFNTAAATTVTLSGTNTVDTGGILETATVAANAAVITGGTLQGPSGGDLILHQYDTTNSLIINSTIGNNGGSNLVKAGPGTVILTANETYAGNTTIGAGTLQIGSGGGSSTGSINMAGNITDNGTLAFDRSGSLSVTKQINGIGGTTVSGGLTLTTDYTAVGAPASNMLATGALTLNAGTLNIIGTTSAASSQTFSSTVFQAGSNVVSAAPASGTNNPTLNLGAFSVTAGGMVQFVGPATIGSGNVPVAATATITTTTTGQGNGANPTQLLIGGVNGNTGTGTDYATVGLYDWAATSGTSPFTIVGGSQIPGFYVTLGGTTAAPVFNNSQTDDDYDVIGNLNLKGQTSRATINSLRFNTVPSAGSTLTVLVNAGQGGHAGNPVNLGGILITPNVLTNNVTFQTQAADALESSNSTSTGLTVWQNNTSAELIFLQNNNTVAGSQNDIVGNGYFQAGPGTVSFQGLNNYGTTGTVLNGGVLEISNPGIGSDTGDFDLGTATSNVTLNGGTLVANYSGNLDQGSLATAHPVLIGGTGGGLAATSGNTLTVTGVVSGAIGTGPLVVGIPASSANGNTVGLVPGTGAGTANLTAVNATGTVILNNTANTYTGGTVVDSGILQLNSTNLNVLGTGGITLNGGTFQWGSVSGGLGADISARPVTLTSTGTFDTQTNNVTLANSIGNNGAGGFTKTGTGTLTLNGANTFTGGVTLSQGNLTLGGTNVYSGATNVNAGALTLNSSATLGNTAITVTGGTSLVANPGSGNIQIGSTAASLTLNTGAALTLNDGAVGKVTVNSPGAGVGTALTLNGTSTTPDFLTLDVSSAGAADELIANNGTAVFAASSPQTNITLKPFGTSVPATLTGIPLLSVPNGTLSLTDFNLQTNVITTFGSSSTPPPGTVGVYNASLSLNGAGNTLLLNLTQAFVSLNFYYKGGGSTTPGSWGDITNFATDTTGATVQSGSLTSSSNVFLTATTASSLAQTLNGSYSINSLSFTGSSTSAGSGPIVLANGSGTNFLTLNAGNSFVDTNTSNNYASGIGLVVEAGSAAHTISANLKLGNSQTWEIDNSSANPLTVSGIIANGASNNSLTKTGPGTLILSNSNSYSGGTFVNAGTLAMGTSSALLSTGALTVQGTGTFDLAGNAQTVGSLADGGVATGTITSSSGTPALTVNNSAPNAYSGTISGSAGVTMAGPSSLTLSGNNNYTGLTTVSSGTVNATSDHALGSNSSATGGVLLNPSAGTATVNFTSATPSIASLASSGAGTSQVVLGNSTAGSPTTLTVGGGGKTTVFSGAISDGTLGNAGAIGNLTVSGGSLTLSGANTFTGTTTVSGGTLTLGNPLALQNSTLNNQGGVFSFGALTAATLGGLSGSQSLALTNASAGNVTLQIGHNNVTSTYTGTLGGGGSIIQVGSGTTTLGSGANGGAAYTGNTTLDNGTVVLGGNSNLAGSFDLTGDSGAANLVVQDNAIINTSSFIRIDSGLTNAGAGANGSAFASTMVVKNNAKVTAASLALGGTGATKVAAGTLLTVQDTATLNVTGTLSLLVDAAGTTQGGNTVLSTVNLNGGTLGVGAFATPTGGNGTQKSAFNFSGGTLVALASDGSTLFFPSSTQETVDVNAGGAPINTNGFNITIAQALLAGTTNVSTGTDGGLTKSGSGKLTLTGANTYTGPTTINLGTLQFGQEVSLYNNVQTNWTPTNIIVNSGTTAAFNVGGSGEFFDSDIATLLGMASTATTGFENNSTLGLDTTNAFGTYDFNSAITNSNGNVINVTKLGPNTLTLHGANTYTGITTISAGTLQFANENTLYSNNHASWTAANLIVNSGATAAFNVDTTGGPSGTGLFTAADIQALASLGTASGGFKSGSSIGFDTSNDSTGNFTYSSAIANPNSGANVLGVAKLGFNTLTLPSANTYTGLTTVFNGTLVASNNSSLGSFTATTAGLVMNTTVGSPVVIFTASAPAIASLASNGPGSSSVVLGNSTAGSPTTLTVGANNTSTGYSGQITDGTGTNPAAIGSLIKTGTGTLTLTGQSNYTGKTTISQGTLALGNTNAISSTSQVILAGGTLATGGFGQDFTTAPLPATPATLKVTANSVLDFGTPPSFQQIKFAKSNGTTVPSASWTPGAILRINNWTGTPVIGGGGDTDQLLVGSDATGLDPTTQLQDIHFTGYLTGAVVLDVGSNNPGEVVPASATQLLRGDVTQNLHVDAGDIVALENALANLSQYEVAHSFDNLDALDVLDVNKDGSINNADVQALINLLVAGGGGNASVPEPSSLILLGLAGLVFLGRSYRQGTFQGAGAQRTS